MRICRFDNERLGVVRGDGVHDVTAVLDRLRLLYTEVSLEPVHESAGLLSGVEALLASRFVNVG
jgi:hypothetical protein